MPCPNNWHTDLVATISRRSRLPPRKKLSKIGPETPVSSINVVHITP
jgi:hypothetical protein